MEEGQVEKPKIWESPDGKIKKHVIKNGTFGAKPTESAVCTVTILEVKSNREIVSEYIREESEIKVVIGEANTALDREIDKLLLSMMKGEMSTVSMKFTTQYVDININFQINLLDFESKGYMYQWPAEEKFRMALNHKEKGVELFRAGRYVDASHRFSRGLKLLLSIPVPVDEIPEKVDEVLVSDLENYKANLYNNLASCYLRENLNDTVIELSTKVLKIEDGNCKALCKRGFAYSNTRDFERAKQDLMKVLEKESDNKAVIEKLQFVNANISQQEANYASMVKKMFGK